MLLLIAVEEIGRILSGALAADQDTITPCDPWTVRDVIAHCSGSLLRLVEDRTHGFTPAENELDVEERRAWEFDRVRDELQATARPAAGRIDAAGGEADGLGLGVWIHAGDVRGALGVEGAYAGPGLDLGLDLLVERSRRLEIGVAATVDGVSVHLGSEEAGAVLEADADTFVRLLAGRETEPVRYTLSGVEEQSLVLFT